MTATEAQKIAEWRARELARPPRVSITKSRSGHYTTTVRYCGHTESVKKLDNLVAARDVVADLTERVRKMVTVRSEVQPVEQKAAPEIKVVRAYTLKDGREVRDGWDVLVDGEWNNRFRTKKEAEADAHAFAANPNV